MSSPGKHFYEFGPFRIDPAQRLLYRDNHPVPLQPKAFEALLILIQHNDSVVLKNDLMNRVWGDTFVEESNVAQTIFVLRKALGESGGQRRYILTVPGRGYRFGEVVRVIPAEQKVQEPAGNPPDAIVNVSREIIPTRAGMLTIRLARVGALLVAGLCLVLVVAALLRPAVAPPRIARIQQITEIGSLLYNTKLITDGPRIYFRAWEGHDRVIRYISTSGGDPVPVDPTFPNMDIDDISADGSEFLVVELRPLSLATLWWVPVSSGSPRPLGTIRAQETRCSPDGEMIAYSIGADLYLATRDGSNPRKLATLPGELAYLQWSPEGKRLRFSVINRTTNGLAIWQADLPAGTVHPLLPGWAGSWRTKPGGWTPDGRYFFFIAEERGTSNIWAIREDRGILHRSNAQPVQLTAGPLNFYQPTPSKDGKSVFAVGEKVRGELMRSDAALHRFVPYAGGRSIDQVAFSRDGQWMAYVEFPEGVLMRSRVDGSARQQLTFAPMRAYNPQWSPDGTQLAFDASPQPGKPRKIYLLPRDGGAPVQAVPTGRDLQLYPSWFSGGNALLFSSLDETGQKSALYSLDLESRRVSALPGADDLTMGQISPDGRQIVALMHSTDAVVLYDTTSHERRTLAESGDFPRWTVDGKYIYFRTLYFGRRVQNPGVYRWVAATDKVERVMPDPEFRLNGLRGVWTGATPDGSLLFLRDLTTDDLYVLDVELP